MPYLEKLDVYEAIQSGNWPGLGRPTVKVCPIGNFLFALATIPFPGTAIPGPATLRTQVLLDNVRADTTTGERCTITFRLALRTGRRRAPPPGTSANGVFHGSGIGNHGPLPPSQYPLQVFAKVLPNDFKDGQTATLLITENINAHYYSAYDDWSSAPTNSILTQKHNAPIKHMAKHVGCDRLGRLLGTWRRFRLVGYIDTGGCKTIPPPPSSQHAPVYCRRNQRCQGRLRS